jgi:hypothetical protein
LICTPDNLEQVAVSPALLPATLPLLLASSLVQLRGRPQTGHGSLKVVLSELALLVHDKVEALRATGIHIVLQRHRSDTQSQKACIFSCHSPVVGVDDVARLVMSLGHPTNKLFGIGNGGGQKHESDFVRQQDDALLPHHAALLVTHVMNLHHKVTKITHE